MASVTHSSPGEPGSSSATGNNLNPSRRAPRSKQGCLTCRRRKVRCNEQRPRCSHCERLNLQCTWRSVPSLSQSPRQTSENGNSARIGPSAGTEGRSVPDIADRFIPEDARQATIDGSFNDMFDYASFMWDHDLHNGNTQPGHWRDMGFSDMNVMARGDEFVELNPMTSSSLTFSRHINPYNSNPAGDTEYSGGRRTDFNTSNQISGDVSEEIMLKDYFVRTVVPPIIAQVETQLRWSSMRQVLTSMSTSSAMVHSAILAFSGLLLSRNSRTPTPNYQKWYESARMELSRQRTEGIFSGVSPSSTIFEYMLAALFFLSYIDLLEGRIVDAHSNLKEAYEAFQAADKSQLRMVSKRLISWMRLLDARAVTAGGEGLFLLDDDDIVAQPSPASTDMTEAGGSNEIGEANVEDVLFDTLYQPGFFFFQRIQSFMGRISKIDPWHRSRGTVEDETEVMSIAAKISRDLGTLWESRPPLMDYALNGKLTSAHLSPSLVFTITRTFRTYFANYNASNIHLHRVAYKHLPLSAATEQAISNIRDTTRLMVEIGSASGPEQGMLPVNMLWPLLMWGTEENDPEAREWIIVQINNMEQVATNAKTTAQVLQEVQKRQDVSKQRVDVRTVMHDIFNSCFAIV